MSEQQCECPRCRATRGEPLNARWVLNDFVEQLAKHHEGESLLGFDPELLSLVAATHLNIDGEEVVAEIHAEEQKGGWKIWVVGAPRGTITFEGGCLTGHGWRRKQSTGAYSKPGIVTVHTPQLSVDIELD